MNAIISKTALASDFKPTGDVYWDWYDIGTAERTNYSLSSGFNQIDMSSVFVQTGNYHLSTYGIFAAYIETDLRTSSIKFGCFGISPIIPNPQPYLSSPIFGFSMIDESNTLIYTNNYSNSSTHPANLTARSDYQVDSITIKVILRGAVLKAV